MGLPKLYGRVPAGMGFALSRQVRGAPTIPWDIQDAVQVWGRERGRPARMVWNTTLCANYGGCAEVRIDLKPDDPRLRPWQEGRAKSLPFEPVFFHEWDKSVRHYKPINIHELGPSGVVAKLDEGYMWSGRGKHKNILELAEANIADNAAAEVALGTGFVERNRDCRREHRRQLEDVPQVNVPTKLEK